MFGIDSSELAVIALVALLVIGPKDLPRVMRMVGQWMAKGRAMTRHVRAGFDTMMREAELEEMQKQWAAQNDAIMKASALPDLGLKEALPDLSADAWMSPAPAVAAEMRRLHAAAAEETVVAPAAESIAESASQGSAPATAAADKPRRRAKTDPIDAAAAAPPVAPAVPPKPVRKRAPRAGAASTEPQPTDS